MSMSTHVIGIKPPNEKWKAMKKIFDACSQASVAIPQEVQDFFEGISPDPAGVVVQEDFLESIGAVTEYEGEEESGLEVHLDKLPKDIKVLRFTNSW